jgi:ATP-dependent helicase HepA
MWKPGQLLLHRFNPDLGPGRILAVSGRSLKVEFPLKNKTLLLAADPTALDLLTIEVGTRVRPVAGGPEGLVARILSGAGVEGFSLADGRVFETGELLPVPDEDPLERLVRGDVDSRGAFKNRVDGLALAELREADGLGSFLGGRIRLFPHQLYVAERATAADPVRWLLADEVGLGKTVEACLIMNHLLRTGRVERTLVVAPETLVVQWLGELWRKYHQVFVLLDAQRRKDVVKEYGKGFNPFDAHPRAIVALEELATDRHLAEQAAAAGIDLLVVDEAHRLKRQPNHPGNAFYRAVAPLAESVRHVLFLSATPLEDDAHGFFRLLQLLRPEELPGEDFRHYLEDRKPLPPCTSACRREDVGGLPPRVPMPVALEDAQWEPLARLENAVRALPAPKAGERKARRDLLHRAFASPWAAQPLLDTPAVAATGKAGREAIAAAAAAGREDPRLEWLVGELPGWQQREEKTLLFVAHQETLDALKGELERRGIGRVGIFHEGLSATRRDIEVAQLRLPAGPTLLISTECGGEGRNFEFCRRLVLYDLPWGPGVVEQRIGRLDRIGRTLPTEIVYFKPPEQGGGLAHSIVELYETMGLFEAPLGGVERHLQGVEEAIEELALTPPAASGGEEAEEAAALRSRIEAAQVQHAEAQAAAYHTLHRDPYRAEMAEEILARVPEELEALTQKVVLRSCDLLGLKVDRQLGERAYSLELASGAVVETLPGLAGDATFVGTFDREEGVQRETLDFFASGHPLVEGVLAELEDGSRGRAAMFLLEVEPGQAEDFGLIAFYKKGSAVERWAVDRGGRQRPEWLALLDRRPRNWRRAPARDWARQPGWEKALRRIAEGLPEGRPVALAAVRFVKERKRP